MSRHPEKAVVVGFGSIAKRHIKNLRALYPDIEIVCVSSSGRDIPAVEVGADSVARNLSEAVDMVPDFAVVASPSTLHVDHALSFLRENIPVLIEKPVSSSLEASKELLAYEDPGQIMVSYNLRFLPSCQITKKLIDDGAVGRIISVYAEVGQYLPDWRPGEDYRHCVSSRQELGGGALLELSHELDYLTWMFGEMETVFSLVSNTNTLDINVEDSVDAFMVSAESMLPIHVHLDFLQRCPSRFMKIAGENGVILWDLMLNKVSIRDKEHERVIYQDSGFDRNEMYIEQIRDFISFVKGGESIGAGLESSLEVMVLVEAIRDSSRVGHSVSLESVR